MHIKHIDSHYEDLCYKSIDYLEKITREYLKTHHNINDPWIVDSMHGTRLKVPKDTEEIVFFGSYLQRILESGNWTFKKARFWVLSKRVKSLISKEFDIKPEFINIIPRNELFKLPSKVNSLPSFDDEISFVYAGRLSESKNIEALLYTTYHLQKIYKLKVQLYLIGEFDNMSSIYSLKEDVFRYEDRIEVLINNLDWNIKPIKIPETSPLEWPQKEFKNPIFVSFSNFISEDFGVSCLQAQEKGWPCILSDWAGHADVHGKNILLVPTQFLTENSGHNYLLLHHTKKAAEYIFNNFKSNEIKYETDPIHNEYISLEELNQKRTEFIINNGGPATMYLLRGQNNKFKAQECGEIFFNRVFDVLSASKTDNKENSRTIIIVNDLSSQVPKAKTTAKEILRSSEDKGHSVELIALNNVMWKTNLAKLQNCSEIHIPFYKDSMNKFLSFLTDFVSNNIKITLYTNDSVDNVSSSITIREFYDE